MQDVSFRVAPGDKIGLVGRNGAGKTTLTKILAGDSLPAAGSVHASGTVGYQTQGFSTGGHFSQAIVIERNSHEKIHGEET